MRVVGQEKRRETNIKSWAGWSCGPDPRAISENFLPHVVRRQGSIQIKLLHGEIHDYNSEAI